MLHSEVDAKLVLVSARQRSVLANTEISAQIAACRKKQIGCLAAMAGIARKIELYNLVYRLAWEHISEHQRREHPDIARRLHDSIRRQVSEGATEAVFIVSEALRDIEKSEPRTGDAIF